MTDRLSKARSILIVGAGGAIGRSLANEIAAKSKAQVWLASRQPAPGSGDHNLEVDYQDEVSLAGAAERIKAHGPLDAVIVTTGILHSEDIQPERALRQIDPERMLEVLRINTVVPALIAKHFLPLIPRATKGLFAVLSARVGSISDNQLGGWYSYRCSKAALNMFVASLAIEWQRSHPDCVAIGLHPGTVDSPLSVPFQKNLPANQLQSAATAASCLYQVMNQIETDASGGCFDYRGDRVPA